MDCSDQSLVDINFNKTLNLTRIQSLSLSGNDLEKIPDLTSLPMLITLDVADNEITELREDSFEGIAFLEHLNISGNKIKFTNENGKLHRNVFMRIPSLKILRMKQVVQQVDADYSFLEQLTELEQLYISPNRVIPEELRLLTNLKKLSLGGSQCSIESLTELSPLKNLTLTHFSARNCGINNISVDFFQTIGTTLKVLDLSCNRLINQFGNILQALQGSQIQSLILDFVNQNVAFCSLNNIDASALVPVEVSNLKALSLQANHIGSINTTLTTVLRGLHGLEYLDISQNTFDGAGFDMIGSQKEQMRFWTNSKLWVVSLKYLRLGAITQNYDCNDYDRSLLDCNQDHELFENDDHEWERVSVPYHMDISMFEALNRGLLDKTIMHVLFESSSLIENIQLALMMTDSKPFEVIGKICKFFGIGRLTSIMKRWGKSSHLAPFLQRQLTNTSIRWFLGEACSNTSLLHNFLKEEYLRHFENRSTAGHRYGFLPFNLTTIIMQDNQINSVALICQNTTVLYNNLRVVQASGSNVGNLDCSMEGLPFLETLECSDCNMHSFNPSSNQNSGFKKLDLRFNHLGEKIRLDTGLFGEFSNMEVLLLGGQKDGIYKFQDSSIFQSMKNLTHLDISDNELKHWNLSIEYNIDLKYLNFSYNQLEYIDQGWQEKLDRAHNRSALKIDISGNPFDCQCFGERNEFIKWLQFSPVIRDKHRLRCARSQSQTLNNFLRQCMTKNSVSESNGSYTTTAVIIACSALVTLVIISVPFGILLRGKFKNKLPWKDSKKISILASFTPSFMDQVEVLKDNLIKYGIVCRSRHHEGTLGAGQSATISDLAQDCSKFLLIISEDYFENTYTANEYRLLQSADKLDEMSTILIVTSPRVTLSETLESMKQNGKFLVWPSGPCSNNAMDHMVLEIKRMAEYSGNPDVVSGIDYVELQEVESSIQIITVS